MIVRSLIILGLVSCLLGCIRPPQRTLQPRDPELETAASLQQAKKYKDAVDLYEKMARESSGTERGAEALYTAGKIRVLPDNPQKEYQRALQNFDEFLRRYPNDSHTSDAETLRSLLKSILELRKENERLSESIEQLKRVDIRQEERRRK